MRDNEVSFEELINNEYNEYFELVKDTYNDSSEFRTVQEFVNSVDKIFEFHEKNLIDESFEVFKNRILNLIKFEEKEYVGILPIINNNYNQLNLLNPGKLNYYFRVSNYCTSLLHIPFQHKRNIGSNRFTDKGIPCFYGGNTILACLKELAEAKLSGESYISCFEYDYGRFPILDLTMPDLNVIESDERFLDRYILSWPIIALCMVRKNAPKSNEEIPKEYIIPQYILKLLSSKKLDHIRVVRYFSTKSTMCKPLINIAIPTTTEKERGYCEDLKSVFMDNDRDLGSPNFLRRSKPMRLKDLGIDLNGSEFSSKEELLKNEINFLS